MAELYITDIFYISRQNCTIIKWNVQGNEIWSSSINSSSTIKQWIRCSRGMKVLWSNYKSRSRLSKTNSVIMYVYIYSICQLCPLQLEGRGFIIYTCTNNQKAMVFVLLCNLSLTLSFLRFLSLTALEWSAIEKQLTLLPLPIAALSFQPPQAYPPL